MKNKFVRSSEHKKIDDIKVNHSIKYSKQTLEMLKASLKFMQKHAEGRIIDESKIARLEDIQMASGSEESDITINNAHKHI